ncbi:MAG: hypothetical protein GY901_10590 [Actinomycetia bacterium]|nr:hypothetical protein [Actinomycetes bacterium]
MAAAPQDRPLTRSQLMRSSVSKRKYVARHGAAEEMMILAEHETNDRVLFNLTFRMPAEVAAGPHSRSTPVPYEVATTLLHRDDLSTGDGSTTSDHRNRFRLLDHPEFGERLFREAVAMHNDLVDAGPSRNFDWLGAPLSDFVAEGILSELPADAITTATDPEVLEWARKLGGSQSAAVRGLVAEVTSDAQTLEALAEDDEWSIRREVARNPNTPAEVLVGMADRCFSGEEHAWYEILEDLFTHETLAFEALRIPERTAAAIEALSRDRQARQGIPLGVSLAFERITGVLSEMIDDLQVGIPDRANPTSNNEEITGADVGTLLAASDACARSLVAADQAGSGADKVASARQLIAGHVLAPVDALEQIATTSDWNHWRDQETLAVLAGNASCPDALRKRLLSCPDPWVRMTAAEHCPALVDGSDSDSDKYLGARYVTHHQRAVLCSASWEAVDIDEFVSSVSQIDFGGGKKVRLTKRLAKLLSGHGVLVPYQFGNDSDSDARVLELLVQLSDRRVQAALATLLEKVPRFGSGLDTSLARARVRDGVYSQTPVHQPQGDTDADYIATAVLLAKKQPSYVKAVTDSVLDDHDRPLRAIRAVLRSIAVRDVDKAA